MQKCYDLRGCLPEKNVITLPGSGIQAEVVVHNLQQQIYSMLNDPHLMKDENLIFPGDTPFEKPVAREVYEDINDGSVYREAFEIYVKVKGRDVLCPLILFIDKTHLDLHGNLCLEPVSFTLGIFKLKICNLPMAWRVLGYIHNQSLMSYKYSLDKAKDYHAYLSEIFKPIVKLQNSGGLCWPLRFREKMHDVCLVCPVLFIIGDTEGHDKMVGHFLNRNNKV